MQRHLAKLSLFTVAFSGLAFSLPLQAQNTKMASGMKMASPAPTQGKKMQSMHMPPMKTMVMPDHQSLFAHDMQQGMAKMNKDMMGAPMTGNPDHDFTAMMIPHHAGAIAMAHTELKYGKDPVLRQLAREIIAGQNKEMTLMKNRLAAMKTAKAH